MKSKVIVLLLAAVIAACGILIWNPMLLTGRFYELTVTSATITPAGWVEVHYQDRMAYGTAVVWEAPRKSGLQSVSVTVTTDDSWSSRDGGFLRWPRRVKEQYQKFKLGVETGTDKPTLIEPGTYRLRPGESLIYYRGHAKDGEPLEAVLEVKSE